MRYVLGALALLCMVACKQPATSYNNTKTPQALVDTEKYAILKFDKIRDSSLFGKNVKPATLSDNDILKIEALVKRQADEYNKKEEVTEKQDRKDMRPNEYQYDNLIHHPEKYYKQLIAVVDARGEREVWVNCLLGGGKSNKKIILTGDGGSYFFNLKINLTKNIAYDFKVNSVE